MPVRHQKSKSSEPLIWERPEPANRPMPIPLSREGIVRAATLLADADGLAAVSLRKVGAVLDVGPMRLYGYVSTKEELLDLMVDAVYAEMEPPTTGAGDWREALRSIAHGIRQAIQQHKWFIDLLGGRPHLGQSALAYQEASFAALSDTPGFEDISFVMQAIVTVNSYVLGAIQVEANELRAIHKTGMDEAQWQSATAPYLERMFATGRFPNLSRVVQRSAPPASADLVFDQGLDVVLDGVAGRLAH